MNEKQTEIIKKTIQEFVEKIGYKPKVEIEEKEDGENLICNVSVEDDSNLLIGQYGVNLQALQHLARLLIRKKTDEKAKFILDVNNYRQEKNESVLDLAKQVAEEVIREKRAIIMRPMSAYERRLVHMELADNMEVSTESVGEGESRKVVVKPAKSI
jgi:spoIIIJ-associated protein